MAYSGEPKVPEGFMHLADVSNYPLPKTNDKHVFNTIGVCTDFLPCVKTRGTDFSMKFTLNDPYYQDQYGVSFQLFIEKPSMAPAIQHQGDVIIIRNAEKYNSPKMGVYYTLKKGQFSWAVLEHVSLSESTGNSESVVVHRSERYSTKAPNPSPAEIEYARAILALQDSSRWQAPAPSTALQISATMVANGGSPRQIAGKHRIISELQIPSSNRCYVDLTVEIRRMYQTDMRIEYSVTDYSENENLYDHSPISTGAYDPGDPYNYANNNSSLANWTGPWGKRTMNVVLWEPHRSYALQNLSLGSFISLRNVHMKMDSLGSKLEGVVHGDNINPDKILVSRLSATDAEWNASLKSLLQRKRDHEQYCSSTGLPFVRDADPAKMKKLQGLKPGPDDGAAALESNNNAAETRESGRTKKNRKKKEKQRAKAAAKTGVPHQEQNKTANAQHEDVAVLAPNAHVRTNETAASLIRVDEILDPKLLRRQTLKGNSWQAPFQNARYKSRVVVVDYFPKRLEEFVVKVRGNQYAVLDGDEEEEDVDVDAVGDAEMNEGVEASEGGDKMELDASGEAADGSRWEWRFMLVVQDPTSTRRTAVNGVKGQDQWPKQIQLMVSGQDADYLLREEACDLRRNKKALARLREKMFVLWGDLQERIEEEEKKKVNGADESVGVDGDEGQGAAKARSQPFECYIAEYGVKRDGTVGDSVEDWERCWRMVHTTVA